MSIPAVKGYDPLCVTPRSQVCDEQGVGQWPMWKRYDGVKSIVDQYVDEPYRDFLAMPYHDVDQMKAEELFYWYTPRRNCKYVRLSQAGDDYGHYKRILDDTLAHYNSVVEKLKKEGDIEKANFLQLSLKYAGESEECVYCGEDRVVTTVWGMRPRAGYEIGASKVEADLFPPTELHTVRFDIGQYGKTDSPTILKKSHGSRLFDHQIPQIGAANGYTFTGWDKEPTGAEVNSDLLFQAQYRKDPQVEKTIAHRVRFLTPDGQVIKELNVEHGNRIHPDLVPQLPKIGDRVCTSWDGDPLNDVISSDRDYKAIPPPMDGDKTHIVRFLAPDGQIIKELNVEHGNKIPSDLIPPLPKFCKAWSGDPLNDVIYENKDYNALAPDVDPKPHTVRFLAPDGEVLSQFRVDHGTTLESSQVPPLPVVDGETCPGWDRDPLAEKIMGDKDFTARLPKKRRKGLWDALLKWLLLALGLLLLFLLLWCLITGKCRFNICGCDCDCNGRSDIVRPEPRPEPRPLIDTIHNSDEIPEPSENCGVHFSGWFLSDRDMYPWNDCSEIFGEDEFGEYVGQGLYPDNTKILCNSMRRSFDAVAVGEGTRLIIYSKPNFEGRVVLNVKGPILIENVVCRSRYGAESLLNYTFSEPLQRLFPPERRRWSSENMHEWAMGSCKIICQ